MFCRFFEGVKDNGLISSSPWESINSDIRKMKAEHLIKVFHLLEIIGYNRCIDLLNITSEMTPYCMKRKEHLETKAQRLEIVEEESYSTSMIIVDPQHPHPEIRWEINTRDYWCPCGKYTDRGFTRAHMVKAFQYLNDPYEQCVHACYFSSTIKESIKDINSPVSLDFVEKDENLHSLHAHSRECRTKRYLFGFERSKK